MIKVRFIAPVPNPLNGHSYISGKLLSYLVSENYILKVINLNSKIHTKEFLNSS